ncbi:glycoside hydrolase family 5 protein [Flavihumibacter sp. UBA7668]|uniref:glycoside hydrolase family 5 protein n=1 Tax=Flavihumibacter sp. UBA7668 TaxID=1946542 RepID=UPI0025C1F739|nr:glycoside hydrolase family 5 protein [Flavihumibacter sp. UBA7668]
MRRYTILFLIFLPSILCAQPVKKYGQLKVIGTQLCNQQGQPAVLRGMSFGWHNFWPRFYTEGAVSWLHQDWKVDLVRAAMGIEPAPRGYLHAKESSMKAIETVINAAIKEGIYVIVDWHSHNIQLEEARAFFKDIATRYGHHPNIIYEIFNEPDQESWPEVKAYSIELISTIRSIDKDNIILVGNPHWDQDVHLVADDPITDQQNIMYTLHYYAATHHQSLRNRGDYALSKGIPLFISESAGMEATGNGPLNETEWQRWIDWSEKHRISWVTWSVSDKDETCSVLLPSASSEGNWSDKDLKLSGIKTRAYLRQFHRSGGTRPVAPDR